jgi:iron complex transport system substrate-binding protein
MPLVIALLVIVFLPASGGAAQTLPLPPPSRIVSLVPSVTEILFAIGAGSKVVGVSSFDRQPPAVVKIPRVGGLLNPDVERIFRLRPDFVVVYATQTDLRAQLARARMTEFAYTNTDLAGVAATMRQLGKRLGVDVQANRAADDIERRLQAIRSRVAGRARPRILLVFGREPRALRNIDAAGGVGFHQDVLEVAGAVNVLADVRRATVQLASEAILRLAPDAIIDLHYGDQLRSIDIDAERNAWNQLPAVPAVKTGHVYLLLGDEFVVPGPRIAEATEKIARALHPDAFR